MRRIPAFRLAAGILAVGAIAACADPTPMSPPSTGAALWKAPDLPAPGARGLTVMTRNVMFGGDLTALADNSSPDPVPVRMATFYAQVLTSDFKERAGTFAREIATNAPDVVGLQEMALFRIQDPSDAIAGGTTPATAVALDFLAVLQDSLLARGLSYHVAASHVSTDAELPALMGTNPDHYVDIRYTDRNVILARDDVPTGNELGATFAARVSVTLMGIRVRSERGWASTEATVGGVTYRFVTAHLERGSGSLAPISELQATELIAALQAETMPMILTCDCNSPAAGTGTRSYGWLVAAASQGGGGFVDAWTEANPRDPGFTARLPLSLTERLDLVLVRQGFGAAPAAGIVGGVHATVIGEEVADQTPTGRFPSDHAGVVAMLQMPKALARR